jgi:elongator complex protein 4
MGFQKKKVVIGAGSGAGGNAAGKSALPQGIRPSPLDGRLTTSSGTASLDQLLAGHSGIPLGTGLLLEEHGTTDFGGIALRYFAVQGLVHGHHVHVLGYGEPWKMELPGLVDTAAASQSKSGSSPSGDKGSGKMKIAWRYESLGSTREREGGNTAKIGWYHWSNVVFEFCTNT